MSQRTCASCANPVRDSVTICGKCERETSRRLGDIRHCKHCTWWTCPVCGIRNKGRVK